MSSLLDTIVSDDPVTIAFDVTVELLRRAHGADDPTDLLMASGIEFAKLSGLCIGRHPELTPERIRAVLLRLIDDAASTDRPRWQH